MRKILLNRNFVLFLTLWMGLVSVPPSNAFAMPSASVTAFDGAALRQVQIQKIMTELSRPEARTHLVLMRINRSELQERLNGLDDAQLASVSKQADAIKAAGDAGLGIIITLLVIGILAIIFVRLANKEKITG